jgi:uncharacterized repeat protein (TIGR01451 family)
MSKRYVAVVLTTLLAVVFTATAGGSDTAPAAKSPNRGVADTAAEAAQGAGQHGSPGLHLPASNANVELVSKLKLSGAVSERITDVSVEGNYAYLGNASEAYVDDPNIVGRCVQPGGVHVVDISDVRNPSEVGFIATTPGSWVSEGVHAVHIETAAFRGDILAHSNETCGVGGIGGMSLWDVTNPRSPQPLALHAGDMTREAGSDNVLPRTIHSVFIWQQGANAYAVQVDNHEVDDVDIFDITDPRTPILIAETGLADWPGAQNSQTAMGSFPFSFIHDVTVKNIGGHYTMAVSYWDAGYVLLNVDNPASPQFIEDSDFPTPDSLFPVAGPEGNAHYAEFSHDNRFLLVADEDFNPYGTTTPFKITTGPNAGTEYPSTAVSGATGSVVDLPDRRLNGPVIYGGYGCPPGSGGNPASPGSAPFPTRAASGLVTQPGEEAIIVFQRGPTNDPSATETACFPGEKAANGINAGYDAVVIVNRHGGGAGPVCGSGAFPLGSRIVAVCTTHTAFHRMFNTEPDETLPYPPEPNGEPDIGTRGERIDITAIYDGWGYLRLLDANTMQELDAYTLPEAGDPRYASGFGDLSIHETATDPTHDITYISWYSGGFRVMSHAGGQLDEVGHYIDEGGNNLWGVEVHMTAAGDRYILGSDRDYGLYVYRYGADAAIRKTAPAAGTVGQTVAYTLHVTNNGTIDGRNAVVTDTLPSNVQFSSVSASQGSCTGGSTVTCNLGVLARNGAAAITILGTATAAGTATNTAAIATTDVDPSSGNNRAQGTTAIGAAPAAPPPPPPPAQPPPPRPPRAATCRVPNVRGRTVARARTLIRRAGCRVGRVSRRRTAAAAATGRVIGQSPRAGARVRRGTRVNIVLGARARATVRRVIRPPFTG